MVIGNNNIKIFGFMLLFGLISIVAVFFFMFMYVAVHDYGMVEFVNVAANLKNNSQISQVNYENIEGVVLNSSWMVEFVDYFWLFSFVSMIIAMLYISYTSRREGYFSTLAFINFGVMAMLFLSSIFVEINDYVRNVLIDGVLQNLTVDLTFFNFYFNNFSLINVIIVAVCLLLNFVDFDINKFSSRKDKGGSVNDEI